MARKQSVLQRTHEKRTISVYFIGVYPIFKWEGGLRNIFSEGEGAQKHIPGLLFITLLKKRGPSD